MLGGLAGAIGLLQVLFLGDWVALTPELTAPALVEPRGANILAIGSAAICMLGASGVWRAPRLSAIGLSFGAFGLVQGVGYTPFTLLPVGFAVVAAGLAMVLAISDAG